MAANSTTKLDFTKFYNIINGKLETTPKTRHSVNPSTLEPLPEVPLSTAEDVDRAVQAAKVAQESWAETPYEERKKAVAKLGDLLEENMNELSVMLSKEQGKPVSSKPRDGDGHFLGHCTGWPTSNADMDGGFA